MNAARKKTLEAIMVDQVQAFAESDRPSEIITANVDRLFSELVREAFSSHGTFAAGVKAEFARALPANLSKIIELPRYNDLVANALRERWEEAGVTGDLLRRAKEAIDDLLRNDYIPEFISLRELLDAFVEVHQVKASERDWHVPHISITETDGVAGRGRYIHVLFDAEPEFNYRERHAMRERTRADIDYPNRITIHITGNNDLGHEFGQVITAVLEGEPIGRHFTMTTRWKKLVACLYFGASKLVVDCGPEEFAYD